MKNLKRLTKRGLSLFIALVMCMSVMQLTAFAEDGEGVTAGPESAGQEDVVLPAGDEDQDPAVTPDPVEPAEGEDPSDGEAPAEGEEPSDGEKPAEGEEPSDGEKPAEGEEPAEGETPADSEKPAGGEEQTAPASLEDEAVVAFLAAVKAMEELSQQEEPDPDAMLAAQQTVIDCFDALSEEQTALLDATRSEEEGYTEMVTALREGIMTTEEPEEEPQEGTKPFTVGEESYATLAEAVDKAPDGSTILVTEDVTMTECARFYNKSLTIDGQGHTLTRGEVVHPQNDPRSWYNPALIEVQTTTGPAGLTLTNITLDDGGKYAGTVFAQAPTPTDGGGALQYVQDGIVASNATYPTTITLGSGAVLQNFGGMSAVRVTSAATLVMKSGSKIEDTMGQIRQKGAAGSNGPAGAVWIQGGEFIMNEGAEITGVNGRAVYIDSGSATINGTISNITANSNMWQGQSGAAIHVRGSGFAVLGETGVIDVITGNGSGYTGAVMTNGSRGEGLWDFEAKPGSIIRNVTGFPTLYSNYGTELLNGSITGCSNDFIIGGFAQKTTIGETGVIEQCTAKGGAANAIVYTSNACKVFLKGKVQNNTASYAFYIINQSGGGATLEMYDGALISKTSGTGVYINASECSFKMHGGTITENGSYGAYIREKANRAAWFTMEGGKITNNGSYGVYNTTNSGKRGYVNITGGEISGNGNSYSPYQISISGANAEDELSRVHLAPGVVKAANGKDTTVNTSFGTLTLDADYADISLGNAKSAASGEIKTLVAKYGVNEGDAPAYMAVGSYALWFKPTSETLHFTISRDSVGNKSNFLKVAYIPLNADGTPTAGAQLTVVDVENTEPVDVSLEGLTPEQPYALMWMQPNDDAEGVIQLSNVNATSRVEEVLGQEKYQVNYTIVYEPKTLYSSISLDDTFTVTAKLDPNLTYTDKDSMTVQKATGWFATNYYEQIGEPVYDAEANTVSLQFKVIKKVSSSSKATINLSATFDGSLFDGGTQELQTNAAIISELTTGGKVDLKTKVPCITKLAPLPLYTVTYTGGSTQVKKGTALAVDPGAGTLAGKIPETVTENIGLSDPTREGYDFAGWDVSNNTESHTLTLTARWTRAAHDHQWGPWVRITDPDCTTPGLERHNCTLPDCDVTQDRAIAALGHNWSDAWESDDGGHWHVCTVCGATSAPEVHTYPDTWTVRTPATTTAEGEETRTCTICGHEETRTIPMLTPTTPVNPVTPVTPNEPDTPVIPDTPTPLDPGTDIGDQDVPLAGTVGLNDTDHFAYIKGYEDGTVRPLNDITRAEVATIFFRLMTEEYRVANWSTSNSFTDAQPDAWYNAAISTAAKAGILKGYGDGSVKPGAAITRAEFAAIAARFLGPDADDEDVGDFADTASHWAAKEIRMAAKAGWVKGDGNSFRPNDPITRAEVVTIVNRMLDRVPDVDHMLPDMKTWSDNPAGTWYYAAIQEATNDHAYERGEDGATETWTELTEEKDWSALEAQWAANNGASAAAPETEPEAEDGAADNTSAGDGENG